MSSSRLAVALQDTCQHSGMLATVAAPGTGGARLKRILAPSRSMRLVDLTRTAARFNRLLVDSMVAERSTLIGVSHLGEVGNQGPGAIGLWTCFADPRLAIPIQRLRRRHPDIADIALAFSPSMTLLMAKTKGYVVSIFGLDLVAVELVGLAVNAANQSDPELRLRPWEDPVVQRATEIGLGVERPDQIGFQPEWAGQTDPDGMETLAALSSTVRELLNLRPLRTEPSSGGIAPN